MDDVYKPKKITFIVTQSVPSRYNLRLRDGVYDLILPHAPFF